MTLLTLAGFALAIFVLFLTPGPGNIAMVARTLDAGPRHGVVYGLGILTGDIFWLTLAVFGLAAASDAARDYAAWFWIAKIVGAAILLWFAWGAFQSYRQPAPDDAPPQKVTRRGLAATYAAGVAMPLTNPKPIVFYLTFLPAFFDLSQVGPLSYGAMIAVMGVMFILFAGLYVGLAHKARDWLKAKGIKRWADLITAVIMASVAVLLLVR